MMIDAHIHADTRPYEDFTNMAIAGVESVISCAHDPLRMSTSDVVLDHIHRILHNDHERAVQNGLQFYAAIGIHPRSISIDYERVLNEIPHILADEKVVAIGEIGLEKASPAEKKVFEKQLVMAQDLGYNVIVHTPRNNKAKITKETKSIILDNIDPTQVLIDHVDQTIIKDVQGWEGMLGITVQPQKMTPEEAVEIIEEYGSEKFILNSDMSSSPSDPLAVPRTVHQMKLEGFPESDIKKVSQGNATDFFKI